MKLDRFHVSAFARLLEKMDTIKEANGSTLLDNTIFTMGAGLGAGSTHQPNDLPLVVAGGGGGKLKLGKHVQCARGTPLANLWLTHLRALGIKQDRRGQHGHIELNPCLKVPGVEKDHRGRTP